MNIVIYLTGTGFIIKTVSHKTRGNLVDNYVIITKSIQSAVYYSSHFPTNIINARVTLPVTFSHLNL